MSERGECGQRAFTDALHPSTLPHAPPPPSHSPLPTLQRDSLRPWPCETALCRLALLISSLPLPPSNRHKSSNHYTTRGKLLGWSAKQLPSLQPRPTPTPRTRPHRRVPLQIKRQTKFLFLWLLSLTAPTAHHDPTPSHDTPANPSIGSSVFVWTFKKSGKRAGITNSCNPGRLSRLKYSNLHQPPQPFLLVHPADDTPFCFDITHPALPCRKVPVLCPPRRAVPGPFFLLPAPLQTTSTHASQENYTGCLLRKRSTKTQCPPSLPNPPSSPDRLSLGLPSTQDPPTTASSSNHTRVAQPLQLAGPAAKLLSLDAYPETDDDSLPRACGSLAACCSTPRHGYPQTSGRRSQI